MSNISRKLGLVAALSWIALGSFGCVRKAPNYWIRWQLKEQVPGKLDAVWFTRDIAVSGKGPTAKLKAVELIYCPQMQGKPTVCRTAIVWKKGGNVYQRAVSGDVKR